MTDRIHVAILLGAALALASCSDPKPPSKRDDYVVGAGYHLTTQFRIRLQYEFR